MGIMQKYFGNFYTRCNSGFIPEINENNVGIIKLSTHLSKTWRASNK